MSAREQILGRVRAALARDSAAASAPLPQGATPGDRSHLAARATRLAVFCEQLRALGSTVDVVGDEHEAAARFVSWTRQLELASIARSDSPRLNALVAAAGHVRWIDAPAERTMLFAADAGLSCAQLAIAETGTLVLDSTAELHRLVSLVPPVHIALLDADDIVADMGAALARSVAGGLPPTLSFISGPSRTADIELELVVGVHGPRELRVLVVDRQL